MSVACILFAKQTVDSTIYSNFEFIFFLSKL